MNSKGNFNSKTSRQRAHSYNNNNINNANNNAPSNGDTFRESDFDFAARQCKGNLDIMTMTGNNQLNHSYKDNEEDEATTHSDVVKFQTQYNNIHDSTNKDNIIGNNQKAIDTNCSKKYAKNINKD